MAVTWIWGFTFALAYYMLEQHWRCCLKVDADAWGCGSEKGMGWNVSSFAVAWHQQGFSEISNVFVGVLGYLASGTPLKKWQMKCFESHTFHELQRTQISAVLVECVGLNFTVFLKLNNRIFEQGALFWEWRTSLPFA